MNARCVLLAGVVGGVVWWGAGAALASEPTSLETPGVLAVEMVYDEAPFPECHAATLVESNGDLLAAWFGGTHERHPDVGIWVSRRGLAGWSPPREVATGVQEDGTRLPTWNPVLFQPSRGPLMLFYKVGPTPRDWWGMVITSTDGGRTWSTPRRLPEGILGPIKNKPIQLENGDILAPSSSENDGWRVHFERSSDGGSEWAATPPVNDPQEIQAIQPSLLVHRDGRLQAIGRTRRSGVFQVWSTKQGR